MFKKIYIHTRPGVDASTSEKTVEMVQTIDKIYNVAEAYNIEIVDHIEDIDKKTLIIALGGDGTFLHAAKLALYKNTVVSGFNFGRKGFLVDNDPFSVWDDLKEIIDYKKPGSNFKVI